MGSSFSASLRNALAGICEVSDSQAALLEAHFDLMLRWNRRMNLTTVTKMEEAVVRHYAESLFLAAWLPGERFSVVDVGSGAGFPGFPLAVLRPDCTVSLVESVQKKAVFLAEASRGLANVRVLAVRAETLRPEFDWVVSRAVSLAELPRLAPHFAVLAGPPAADVPGARQIQLPWGNRRYLVTGDW